MQTKNQPVPLNQVPPTTKCTLGCPVLDKSLNGGIPCRSITELVGECGSGKTQLCLQLLLCAQLPLSQGGLHGSSLYIYTEGYFASRRLLQLSRSFVSNHGSFASPSQHSINQGKRKFADIEEKSNADDHQDSEFWGNIDPTEWQVLDFIATSRIPKSNLSDEESDCRNMPLNSNALNTRDSVPEIPKPLNPKLFDSNSFDPIHIYPKSRKPSDGFSEEERDSAIRPLNPNFLHSKTPIHRNLTTIDQKLIDPISVDPKSTKPSKEFSEEESGSTSHHLKPNFVSPNASIQRNPKTIDQDYIDPISVDQKSIDPNLGKHETSFYAEEIDCRNGYLNPSFSKPTDPKHDKAKNPQFIYPNSDDPKTGVSSPNENEEDPCSRIFVQSVHTIEELLGILDQLESMLSRTVIMPVRLVVIDSVAALFRSDFDNTAKDLVKRCGFFFRLSSKLKFIANKFDLAVVVTNQVVDFVEPNRSSSSSSSSSAGSAVNNADMLFSSRRRVVPALGLSWSHCVNSRIFLSRSDEFTRLRECTCNVADGKNGCCGPESGCMFWNSRVRRKMQVVFAPHLPRVSCEFAIEKHGLYGISL